MEKETYIKKLKALKIKIRNYVKTNVLFMTFVLLSVTNGFLIRSFTIKNYFAFRPVLADLAVVTLIGAFGYLFKPKNQIKYFMSISILFTIICFINSIYFRNYLTYASFSVISSSLQIADVSDAVMESILEKVDFIYFTQIILLLIIYFSLKKSDYIKRVGEVENGKKSAKITAVIAVVLAGIFCLTLNFVDFGRLFKQWNREFVVSKFGIYTYQFNDLIASVQPQITPLFGYDKKMREFKEYYDQKDYTKHINEYTNMFKGKNLLVIHAESIQNFVINEKLNGIEITPNLNRLTKEGLYFSNFYAQESIGTSSDSEFTFNTSLMPAGSGTVFVSYFDREYVTIPKLLKEKNYYSFSMHANKGNFWNRNLAHKSFGYDNFYYYDKDYELDEIIGLGLSDKSFFRQSVPKIKDIMNNNQNFYGTLIMLSNHTPFTPIEGHSDFEVDYKYEFKNPITGQKEIKSAPYLEGTQMGSYIKSVNYADAAIGQLLDDLEKEGILDNTVIVIYGDHDTKMRPKEFDRYYNYDYETNNILPETDADYINVDEYSYEINRKVPFIIWSKDMDVSVEVDKVMGMYDVLPTLGNMFDFDSKYALGHDIFSINENTVIFPNGNWITDKMYYNSQKEEGILLKPTQPVSIEYIKRHTKIAEETVSVSNGIIIYNLIKKISEK